MRKKHTELEKSSIGQDLTSVKNSLISRMVSELDNELKSAKTRKSELGMIIEEIVNKLRRIKNK